MEIDGNPLDSKSIFGLLPAHERFKVVAGAGLQQPIQAGLAALHRPCQAWDPQEGLFEVLILRRQLSNSAEECNEDRQLKENGQKGREGV